MIQAVLWLVVAVLAGLLAWDWVMSYFYERLDEFLIVVVDLEGEPYDEAVVARQMGDPEWVVECCQYLAVERGWMEGDHLTLAGKMRASVNRGWMYER